MGTPKKTAGRFRTYCCHKCKWNARTDAEASRACVECSKLHIRRELANTQNLDFPTDGQSWVHSDAADSGEELKHANADNLAIAIMRGNSGNVTTLPPEIEGALLGFLRDIQDMAEPTARAFYWLLRGYSVTRAAAQIGVTKQAVSKNIAYFLRTHPKWRALMPTHTEGAAWRRKLNGTW